jgi:hypothetical protein
MNTNPLKLVVVIDPADWHPAVEKAVREIDAKGSSGYTPELCMAELEKRVREGKTIILLAVDVASGKGVNDSVCGMCVVDFTNDFLGSKVALLTYGWIDPNYGKRVFELAWPAVKVMANEQKCREVWIVTLRDAEAFARWGKPEGFRAMYTILAARLT